MTETEWQKLAPHLATAATLADVFPQAFDALTFEYVHILADKSAAGPAKRLLVRDTGTQKIADHDALIKAFQELR